MEVMESPWVKKAVEVLSAIPEVAAVFVFGSHVKGAEPKGLTDVDIAVVLHPYSREAAAKATLALPKPYEVAVLNDAPPILIYEALKSGKMVWERFPTESLLLEITRPVRELRPLWERW